MSPAARVPSRAAGGLCRGTSLGTLRFLPKSRVAFGKPAARTAQEVSTRRPPEELRKAFTLTKDHGEEVARVRFVEFYKTNRSNFAGFGSRGVCVHVHVDKTQGDSSSAKLTESKPTAHRTEIRVVELL